MTNGVPAEAEGEGAARLLADEVRELADPVRTVNVQVSFAVIKLLSEQLYASPVKAIEELVVNGWDAGAKHCSVLVHGTKHNRQLFAVFDDGVGMTLDQLTQLWHVGISHKPLLTRPRKQIGKFGIGKLASYAVARRATYLTKSSDGILAVTINFDDLASVTDEATGLSTPLALDIHSLNMTQLTALDSFQRASDVLKVQDGADTRTFDLLTGSWTLVVLEDLRPRAAALATGRLRWVLETAMPYASDFKLFLDGWAIESSKRHESPAVEFDVHELEPSRLGALNSGGHDWRVQDGKLVSSLFPQGVHGHVVVTRTSLYSVGGKSEDLGRSHGFFVRVHNRLINETDPLFGARPLSFSTWYSFAAEVNADDLNPYITASRDDLEQSNLKPVLRELLIALFNQARDRRNMIEDLRRKAEKEKTEGNREYVSRTIVEQPLADALVATTRGAGDEYVVVPWMLIDPPQDKPALEQLVSTLYDDRDERRRAYTYKYADLGTNEPFARMDVGASVVTLNEGHGLVQEFADSPHTRRVLELFATAEPMLEAYLHEARVANEVVRELLARRDLLLRSLAQDESQSLTALAKAVRACAADSDDSKAFEIAIVGALRALGFAAQHVSGSGTPDGVATYSIYGAEGAKLTLEAKASTGTPTLNAIDMAGLVSHARAHDVDAKGVLLVAPTYPGIDDPDSEINRRAEQQRVSCWTAEQLAVIVENAERRHVTAADVQRVVTSAFTTLDVAAAVKELVEQPSYSRSEIYVAILDALDTLTSKLVDEQRSVKMLAPLVVTAPGLGSVPFAEILEATLDLARFSRGLIHVTEDRDVVLLGDLEEIRRRTAPLTDSDASPRRAGSFRDRGDANGAAKA